MISLRDVVDFVRDQGLGEKLLQGDVGEGHLGRDILLGAGGGHARQDVPDRNGVAFAIKVLRSPKR